MSNGAGRTLGEFKSAHAPEAEVVYLRQRVADLEAKCSKERMATGEALDIMRQLKEAIAEAQLVEVKYDRVKAVSSSPCTHTLHLTDLHYGAMVDQDEIEGFNEFSPEIAEARLNKLATCILDKTAVQRKGYNIPDLHIIGTADYISGDIHHELSVTNAFPSPVQAVRCGYTLGALFMLFASHFKKVTVDLITLDNHGRLLAKPQASQGGYNNYGYVVAEIAKQFVNKQPNVIVNVHACPSALITIGKEKYLSFHGHQIKAWAGIPYYGLDRRTAMEAVKRMGLPDVQFTKMLSGHLHVSVDSMYWRTGGSLSGTDANDHGQGRKSPPHQTSWFVHPTKGEFDFTRWWL